MHFKIMEYLFCYNVKHKFRFFNSWKSNKFHYKDPPESLTHPRPLSKMEGERERVRKVTGISRLTPRPESLLGGIFLVFLVSLVFWAGVAASAPAKKAAESSRSEEIVTRLQKKYETTRTLKARFEQENYLRSLGRTTRSKGRFLMSKPGRIRVEYVEPENQLIVSNGEKFWIYTERLNQVIMSDIGGSGSVPLLFLAGKGNLTEEFRVELEEEGVPKRKEGVWKAAQPYRLSLIPKQVSAGFKKMWIEVDPETFQITGLDYVDALSNKTQIRFFDIDESAPIGAGSFQFKIPSGVEVLRAPSPGK